MIDQGVFSTGQGPAYAPWETWQSDSTQGPLALVRAAILAANPHNTQPWRFHVGESHIGLFADRTRNIGAIDPLLREMTVGLGCALENLLIAARHHGYAPTVSLMPEPGDPTYMAHVALDRGPALPQALYEAIPHRRTHRGAYAPERPLDTAVLRAIEALGADMPRVRMFWFNAAPQRQAVAEGIIRATEAVIADGQQSADSARWMRHAWQDIQTRRDGITVDAQALPALIRTAAKTLPPFGQRANDEVWLQNTRDIFVGTTATFGILAVPDNRDAGMRLQGGQLWQRLHLWGTKQGLAMQPLNQMCERADREVELGIAPEFGERLKSLIGDPSWQALMPFRIGYPLGGVLASPRRDVADVVIHDRDRA